MCKVHTTLQESQAVAQMLHWMAFWLSGNVVSLHLDGSTAKAYLCYQGESIHLSFQTSLLHFVYGQSAWYYSYSNIHIYLLNVEDDYLSWGRLVPEWHLLPHIAQTAFQLKETTKGGPAGIHTHQSISALFFPGKSTTSRSLGTEYFQPC